MRMEHHKWIQLRNFKCPVSGCAGADMPANWVCANCDTPVYIAQTGYMRCNNYSSNKGYNCFGQLVTWRWNCGNHGDHPYEQFKDADMQGFTFALSHAVQLMGEAGGAWVGALCIKLEKQYKNLKKKQIVNRKKNHNGTCKSDTKVMRPVKQMDVQ